MNNIIKIPNSVNNLNPLPLLLTEKGRISLSVRRGCPKLAQLCWGRVRLWKEFRWRFVHKKEKRIERAEKFFICQTALKRSQGFGSASNFTNSERSETLFEIAKWAERHFCPLLLLADKSGSPKALIYKSMTEKFFKESFDRRASGFSRIRHFCDSGQKWPAGGLIKRKTWNKLNTIYYIYHYIFYL